MDASMISLAAAKQLIDFTRAWERPAPTAPRVIDDDTPQLTEPVAIPTPLSAAQQVWRCAELVEMILHGLDFDDKQVCDNIAYLYKTSPIFDAVVRPMMSKRLAFRLGSDRQIHWRRPVRDALDALLLQPETLDITPSTDMPPIDKWFIDLPELLACMRTLQVCRLIMDAKSGYKKSLAVALGQHLTHLTMCDLEWTYNLADAIREHLVSLHLERCHFWQELASEAWWPRLEHLIVIDCRGAPPKSWRHQVYGMPKLKTLTLTNVGAENLDCRPHRRAGAERLSLQKLALLDGRPLYRASPSIFVEYLAFAGWNAIGDVHLALGCLNDARLAATILCRDWPDPRRLIFEVVGDGLFWLEDIDVVFECLKPLLAPKKVGVCIRVNTPYGPQDCDTKAEFLAVWATRGGKALQSRPQPAALAMARHSHLTPTQVKSSSDLGGPNLAIRGATKRGQDQSRPPFGQQRASKGLSLSQPAGGIKHHPTAPRSSASASSKQVGGGLTSSELNRQSLGQMPSSSDRSTETSGYKEHRNARDRLPLKQSSSAEPLTLRGRAGSRSANRNR